MREDWAEVKLVDIGEIFSGGTPKTKNEEYWGNEVPWISPSDLSKYNGKFISKGQKSITEIGLSKSSAKLIPAGSVLFSSRAPIGYVVIANNDLTTNQGFKSINPSSFIFNEFVYYYLKSSKNLAERNASGTTFKEISKTAFSELPFPLSPLPEQRAIVAKIEELFTDLDKGIADLKKAQDQLKVYRQAVLKKAFENLEKETTLEEIKEDSLIGLVRASVLQNSNGEGTAYLKMDKIDMIGNVELEDLVYVETNEDEVEKYALQTGDILLNTRNSYELVGKTGIVRNINKTVVFNNNIMRIRVNESYDPYFICYQLISPFVRKQMDKFKKATTSVCALYQRNLFPLKLKVTDIKEQHQIVQEIESRLSVCDKVEESISESLEKAKALRQIILKKAFEGTLLSEEEIAACKAAADYEPASVLLEKIKAEKKK